MSYIGHFCLGAMGMWKNTRQSLHTHIIGEAVLGQISEYGVTESLNPQRLCCSFFAVVDGNLSTIVLGCEPGHRFQAEVIS